MHPKKLLLFSLALGLFLGSGETIFAQKRKPVSRTNAAVTANRTEAPESTRRLETFQKVWNVINEYYFDQTFNNLDWPKIRAEYEPRVRAAKTDIQLHLLLHEMINRLGRSHLAIIPPEVYQEIANAKLEAKTRKDLRKDILAVGGEVAVEEEPDFDDALAQYGIGVDLRMMNGQFVITRINKNAAAEYAGLKTGYVIEKINDVSLAEIVQRISVYYANAQNIIRELPGELVSNFLNGEKDSSVDITYLDAADQRKQVTIRRELIKSQTISIGMNFPEQQLEYESASLNEEVGYIRFNQFALPVIEKFCTSVAQLKDKKALIIDLRGNSGGVIASMVGLGGMLSDGTIDFGTSMYRAREERLTAEAKAKNFKGRLVFLVDGTTASAAEMFAISFKENGRALVVGEKTAGSSLPSMVTDLPTGAVMQYPIANYRSGKGLFLEGIGVTPDFVVALDRKSLAAGHDLQLEKALQLIKENTAFKRVDLPPDYKGLVNTGSAPPPPPPPKAMPKELTAAQSRVLAEVTVKMPPPVAVKEAPKVKEPAAVKIINDFIAAMGGREQVEKLKAYEMAGSAELLIRGSRQEFDFAVYRQSPDKYAEILSSDSAGEIREVYNGKNYFSQADYGFVREGPLPAEMTDVHLLTPLTSLLQPDAYASLRYAGTYDRDGRKVNLIDGTSKQGSAVALAFDVETKMLLYFTGPYYGMIFGDYRKAGEFVMPFLVEREGIMRMHFDDIKVNGVMDAGKFAKKINCYDVPN